MNEFIYLVNSLKVDCVGVAPMQCLQIQKGKNIDTGQWQNFYSNIEGFEYEPGYLYTLRVKEFAIPPEQVPADGSSIRHVLIEVLDKELDMKLRLHDIWALETIEGLSFNRESLAKHPYLELNLNNMTLMGNDGCNNIRASIDAVDNEQIVFGQLAMTKKVCPEMSLPANFVKNITAVQSYRLEDRKLHLFDSARQELLQFNKVD